MTSPTQPKPTPIPAVLVYGTPTSPELTQASWFRAEDKQAAKAAAEALKFSVIDIQTEAEKALTLGVHEGVLKGSGRMIVGSVASEVYRRIEEYVRKGSGRRRLAQGGKHRSSRCKTGVRTNHEHDRYARYCHDFRPRNRPGNIARRQAGQRGKSRRGIDRQA